MAGQPAGPQEGEADDSEGPDDEGFEPGDDNGPQDEAGGAEVSAADSTPTTTTPSDDNGAQ